MIGSPTAINPGLTLNAQRTVSVNTGGSLIVSNGGVFNQNGGLFSPPDGTFIGSSTGGSLRVESGGVFNSTHAWIGSGGGSASSSVTVTGTGSTWSIGSPFTMNGNPIATATLDVLDGGTVTANTGIVMATNTATTQAAVTVDGPSSLLQLDNSTTVGSRGQASLDVTNQAHLSTKQSMNLATLAGSLGTVSLDGAGTQWTALGRVSVGFGGEAELNITNGAKVLQSDFFTTQAAATIADQPGSIGRVTIDGVGSSWSLDDDIRVGIGGEGSVSVLDNAVLSNADSFLAELPGSTAAVVVDGSGSRWETNGSMDIGGDGTAAGGSADLTVSNTALLGVTGSMKLWDKGRLNIYGGEVTVSALEAEPGAQIDFRHGTLTINSNVIVQPGDALEIALGTTRNVRFGQTLVLNGQTTLNDVMTVDGGTLATQDIVNANLLDFRTGNLFITDFAGLTVGAAGLLGQSITAGAGQTYQAFSLTVDANALVRLEQGGKIQIIGTVENSGRILGSGEIIGTLNNLSGGELIANAGDFLLVSGTATNAGQVSLAGGQVVFTQGMTNANLVMGNGTLRADGGVANDGTLAFSATANVIGDVTNSASGLVTSSGGTLTFFDDVVNNGEIRTNANSFTVYFGSYSGSGDTGTGTVIMEGDLKPGSSPGVMAFGGDLLFGGGAELEIELAGLVAGTDFDQVVVTDELQFDGTLDLQIVSPYAPALGDTMVILTADAISGRFQQIRNVPQTGGLGLAVRYSNTLVDVRVSLRGDTDFDDDVDTSDLTAAIIGFTGAGASGNSWVDGDFDGDGDIDTGDLTTAVINFTGAQAGNPNVPDLVYDPATGSVTIDADGADVISFSLQGGPFNAADFSDLPAGLTDNIASQIGWTSFNLFSGLTGTADLGAILPAGLDLAGLEAALTTASYGLALAGGGGGGRLDVIIPEPGTVAVIGLGGVLMTRRRRLRSCGHN